MGNLLRVCVWDLPHRWFNHSIYREGARKAAKWDEYKDTRRRNR